MSNWQQKPDAKGIFIGYNPGKIYIDFYDRKLLNSNATILGHSGEGKSFYFPSLEKGIKETSPSDEGT